MLLPAALIRLTLNIDLRAMLRLGPKLLAMYLGASLSIMLGAVVAFWVMRWLHPATVAGNTWAGMAALARSWIGGGANMRVMREVFDVDATTFGQFAVVDVGVGYVWMAVLIFLAGRARNIDARSGADIRALDALQERMARFQAEHARIPSLADLTVIVAVAFGGVGLAHALANPLAAWCKAQLSWASQFSLDTPFVCVGGAGDQPGPAAELHPCTHAGRRGRFQNRHVAVPATACPARSSPNPCRADSADA